MSNRKKLRKRHFKSLWLSAEGKCQSCGQAHDDFDVDHVIPLHQGGPDSLCNLQLLCRPCHRDKTLFDRRNPYHFVDALFASHCATVGAIQ